MEVQSNQRDTESRMTSLDIDLVFITVLCNYVLHFFFFTRF